MSSTNISQVLSMLDDLCVARSNWICSDSLNGEIAVSKKESPGTNGRSDMNGEIALVPPANENLHAFDAISK